MADKKEFSLTDQLERLWTREWDEWSAKMNSSPYTGSVSARSISGSFTTQNPIEPCASCGTPLDKHGTSQCPRWIKPASPFSAHAAQFRAAVHKRISGENKDQNNGTYELSYIDEHNQRCTVTLPAGPLAKLGEMLNLFALRAGEQIVTLQSKINTMTHEMEGMQKTLKQYTWDPKVERVVKKSIDYTEWKDEEDCLTDVTRGIPPPKKRIIF